MGQHPAAARCCLLGLAGCSDSDAPDDARAQRAPNADVKASAQALDGAHVPTLDPATLNDAEIRKMIGSAAQCLARHTRAGPPVLALAIQADRRPGDGVVKLNGSLVARSGRA